MRREQRREPDRPRADDRYGASWLNFAVEHAAFEACRQDVAEHDQRFFIRPFGNGIEACVGVGSADEFSLCAVDLVAEDPAAGRAVRVHLLAAIHAFAAGAHAGDQNAISWLERRDGRPDLVDDAHALVAENAAGLAVGTSPLRMCRSVPQIVVFTILTIASVGAVISGFGRSSSAFLPGPR